MAKNFAKIKIGLLCGGPSLEKGISLNSARSVMDHLQSEKIEIFPIYFDFKKRAYRISKAQLYSNTPADFDFKLKEAGVVLSEEKLVDFLKSLHIVFPVMHGPFGEDGRIQKFLEKNGISFVGSGSGACCNAFDKFKANKFIKKEGFFTLPSALLKIYRRDHETIVKNFFRENKIKRAVVKPASGGSSIGVFSVSTPKEALEKANLLFSKRMDTRVVLEPFAQGVEFTMIILQNRFGLPVALPPTEIETDYTEHQIFDFRKKYLPTRQVKWHCPPRFKKKTIEKIQAQGEQIFALFKMKDFGRFDGWVLKNGDVWFCDFNPVSGMEQNSFLFQQASRVGMTHRDVLHHILESGCKRNKVSFPGKNEKGAKKRKRVNIIMGGENSERQVSLMSGTNVWLKLRKSKKYEPFPYLLGKKGEIWELPYQLCLNHTTEEIIENCKKYNSSKDKLGEFEERSRLKLGLFDKKNEKDFFSPRKITFDHFLQKSNFVFIALHGGSGENGDFQKIFRKNNVKFNGPGEKVSQICMEKRKTADVIDSLKIKEVKSIPGKTEMTDSLLKRKYDLAKFWKETKKELDARTLIVKPSADGCSSGIVHLYSMQDLEKYISFLKKDEGFLEKGTFKNQINNIEMPTERPQKLVFEKFVETDILKVKNNKLKYKHKTGWIEITIGVFQDEEKMRALNPSVTLVENEVLTVEEKFQGGTGVNITPPPPEIVSSKVVKRVKKRIEKLAEKMGIEGYSRIDAFLEVSSGKLQIIEINTLPGLTPSTVFYQQGLAENPPIFPGKLLERLIKNKGF